MMAVPVRPLPWLQCIATTPFSTAKHRFDYTFEEVVGLGSDIEEGSDGRSLMIWPLVLQNFIIEQAVIVGSRTNVDDEIVSFMILLEIISDIIDGIPPCFFEKTGSGEGHSNDSTSDVCEV